MWVRVLDDDHVYVASVNAHGTLGIIDRGQILDIDGVQIEQSVSLLHQHSTGAVVWHATPIFAAAANDIPELRACVFDQCVVELGCGTGALACLLALKAASWLATDQRPLIKLAQRNTQGLRVEVKEFDWEAHNWTVPLNSNTTVLAVDTIYNEYLIQPFVDAVSELLQSGACQALVVVQVREPEILAVAVQVFINAFTVHVIELPRGCLVYRLTPKE